ncbi:MAG: adenosine kinase [Chlamydiales bacterium]|nr:adenosine kinase [Chlamydiia bacterium]MCP5508308.1 adenosine kinase [Chlamydiales bacterium]
MRTKHYDILGIAAPFVDHIIRVEESFLDTINGGKGGMVVVDYDTLSHILNTAGGDATRSIGGSAANTIKGLAHFGRSCALFGKIGRDPMGAYFLESATDLGIVSLYKTTATPTGQVACLVTPDGERTMRTFLGSGTEVVTEDLDPGIFQGTRLVHIEGYSLFYGDLVERAAEMAKDAGAMVSIDLASYELVKQFHDRIISLLYGYVDVVIANADETWALTGLPPERGCSVLKDICKTAVVLFGADGCWVGRGNELIHGPAFPAHPIDTTGAGDLFAAGFLHGYLQGHSLEECARYGALTGAAVVEVLGTEIPPVVWEKIHKSIEKSTSLR